MIPLIVFTDLDDTFLSSNKIIPMENKEILDTLFHRNIYFVPCTGRAFAALPKEIVNISEIKFIICADGAAIYKRERKESNNWVLVHETPLGVDRTIFLYEHIKRNIVSPISFNIFARGSVFTDRDSYNNLIKMDLSQPVLKLLKSTRTIVSETIPELCLRMGTVERLSIYYKDKIDGHLIKRIVNSDLTMHWTSSETKHIHILDANCSKGNALLWVCRYLNIQPKNVVFFGDSFNDISAIKAAGDGIAMGNAPLFVKKNANHIARSNNDAGVAKYLSDILPL